MYTFQLSKHSIKGVKSPVGELEKFVVTYMT